MGRKSARGGGGGGQAPHKGGGIARERRGRARGQPRSHRRLAQRLFNFVGHGRGQLARLEPAALGRLNGAQQLQPLKRPDLKRLQRHVARRRVRVHAQPGRLRRLGLRLGQRARRRRARARHHRADLHLAPTRASGARRSRIPDFPAFDRFTVLSRFEGATFCWKALWIFQDFMGFYGILWDFWLTAVGFGGD